MMDTGMYVVFKNSKRVSLKDEDMTPEKLSHIFQVSAHSLYITDDSNVAIFPGASGIFSTFDLVSRGHYEVHGEETDSSSATSFAGQSFSFMRTPSATATAHPQRATAAVSRPMSKTFQRSVYLAELVGGRLSPSRMVVVRFLECESTLQGIIGKVQDAIGKYDAMVLTDAQGNAILESEGTTGSQYWKQNARKILAVAEQDFQELQGSKRRLSRKDDDAIGIGEVTDKIEELVLASHGLPAVTAAVKELTNLTLTQKVILTASQKQTIKDGLSCIVCMKLMGEPMFSQCCRSIIGCRTCVEQWRATSLHCPKCREDVDNAVHPVAGLTETLSVFKCLLSEE